MTIDEAIAILSDVGDINRCCSEDAEALDMAIKALEQQPCDDCISREAVVYYIKGHIHEIISESGIDKNEHTNRILRAIIKGVETMPSVQLARHKGKWMDGIDTDARMYECSVCKCRVIADLYDRSVGLSGKAFCPYCGADMGGDTE